jgi:hypothetical protein
MMLTRSFKELVQRHVAIDPAFAEALLREGIGAMLAVDIDTGKTVLRDYIKAANELRGRTRLQIRLRRGSIARRCQLQARCLQPELWYLGLRFFRHTE